MAKLVWIDDLDTGIAEIDRQHRRIVEYINQLGELRHTHDRNGLRDVIGELVDYTLSHFVFEESLMENAGYMFSDPHKKVHEIFTRRVGELQTRFDLGEDVADELHGMLSRWLFNHNIGKALLWTVLLLALAVTANILGIWLLGSINDWQHWLDAAAGVFLVWRLCLYAATIYGWRWMRRRLLARESGNEARRRLIRAKVVAVIAVAALEISLLVQE